MCSPLGGRAVPVLRPCANLALGRGADDPDSAAGAHFEQAFVAEGAQRAEHGVGVDADHGC